MGDFTFLPLFGLGVGLFSFAWYIVTMVQGFMAYGTAYRLTRRGGDNGLALFGWLFVMGLAAAIPGLGIYLWYKYRNI
jgi:hypothetical protein